MLQSYTNKNIGEFISLPANKLENSTLLETLYFATYINKLKSVNNLSDIKKTPHYKNTLLKWNKLAGNQEDLDDLSKILKLNIQVFNPLKKKDYITGGNNHFKKSYKTTQLLKVKKDTYKPMIYKGGADEFVGDINQLLNDDIVLIDQWNHYLISKYPTDHVILHQGTIEDPTNHEQLMCDALLNKDDQDYNDQTIEDYPQCGITYSGIGFDVSDTFVGKYMYYVNNNGDKVCFNMDAVDKLQKDNVGYKECPYTKKSMIDKKEIIQRFYIEKKYGNEEIYEAVKEYALSTYGEDIDEASLEIDLEYDDYFDMYIVEIVEDFMRNLPALKQNEVKRLEFRYFIDFPPEICQLTSLVQLHLYDNKFTILPPEIGQLTSLENLDLIGNELTSLPPEIGQLTSLKKLDLTINELTSLPREIGKLTSLEKLNLEQNNLFSLPAEIGQLTSLEELILDYSELTSLPAEIGQLTSLKILKLSNNQLTSLPAEIGKLTSLKKLKLSNNQLTSLPAEIGQLTSLEGLSLEYNNLTSLPPEIGQLTSLENLDLLDNELTSLPAEIGQLTSLETLNLQDNQLTSLPAEIGQLTSLGELILYDNMKMKVSSNLRNFLLNTIIDFEFYEEHWFEYIQEGGSLNQKGGVDEFVGDINQLLDDDIVLIDQWNHYLNSPYPTDLVILHQGTIEDPTNPEQLMCDAQLQKETIEYNGNTIENYPQDGISYSGIGFDDDTFTGNYMYYLNSSSTRVCFNISTIESLQNNSSSGYIKCPYTRSLMIDKKKIINRFFNEKKYGNEGIYEAVKEYALSTYGEDYDEAPLIIDLEYDDDYEMYMVYTDEDFMRNLPALKFHKVTALIFENSTDLSPEIGQLTSLEKLYLYGNELTSLPAEIGQLTSLKHLELEENQLTSLPPEIGQLTSLQELNLTDNKLTSLPAEIVQLTSLKKLNLHNNKLTSIPHEIGQLTSLHTLDLYKNELTSLPDEIGQLTSLHTLLLGYNKFTSLPAEIGQLTSLRYLDLRYSKITSLPAEIGQLTSLDTLDLLDNKLSSLPAEIGQLTSLERLYLDGNQFTTLPAEIGQLTLLEGLSLSRNRLTILPPEIGQLTSLENLDLIGNELTSLPPEIGQLTSLKKLDLTINELTSLPREIGKLTSLEKLNLSRNRLTSLPAEIGQLTSLRYLGLRFNKLTSLPAEIGQLTSLKNLELEENQLTSLPAEIGQLRLERVYLRNNSKMTVPLNLKEYLTNKVDNYNDDMFEYIQEGGSSLNTNVRKIKKYIKYYERNELSLHDLKMKINEI